MQHKIGPLWSRTTDLSLVRTGFTKGKLILEGIKVSDGLRLKPHCAQGYLDLGELYAATGDREKALKAVRKANTMCREMGMDYYLARMEKALEKLKAQ